MTQVKKKLKNANNEKKQKRCILQNSKKKPDTEIFAFWVITFKQNMIQTCSAPQNDRWNLSFVKYSSWRKNDLKVANFQSLPYLPTYLVII